MKTIYSLLFFGVFLLLFADNNLQAQTQSCGCDNTVPTFTINLSANPDTSYAIQSTRNGYCCSASGPARCISFNITVSPGANQVNFDVFNPAPPGGAFYQVGCGTPTSLGTPLCIDTGVVNFCVTYCKSGNDNATYVVTTTKTYGASDDITVREGCSKDLSVKGLVKSTVTWNSVFPGNYGDFNNYLSCTSQCDTTAVTPVPTAPPYIDYQVCGNLTTCSTGMFICDTVRVYTLPELVVNVTPQNVVICPGTGSAVLTASVTNAHPPINYMWNTGATTPSITVTSAGTYFVSVTDTLSGCPAASDTAYVINPPPFPPLNPTNNGPLCVGDSLSLGVDTVPGATYVWFGPNGFTSSSQYPSIPTVPLNATGAYGVVAIVNGCYSDTFYTNVVINQIPFAPIATTNAPVCEGTNIQLFASNVTSGTYSWTGVNGFTSTQQNPTIANANILDTGFYSVNVTVNGCTSANADIYVEVHPTPQVILPPNIIVCHGAVVPQTNFSGTVNNTTYNWTNSNPNIGLQVNGNGGIPPFTANNTGTASVTSTLTVTPTANGCPGPSNNFYITVDATPAANFSYTNVCEGTQTSFTDLSQSNGGTIVSWAWDFTNDGVIDNTNQNSSNGFPTAGTYNTQLHIATSLGCKDSIIIPVVVDPIPVANFVADAVCFNQITNFIDSSSIATGGIVNWQWDFGDNSGTSTNANPSYTYNLPGTYNVNLTVISDSGCINTYTSSIDVYDNPVANFTVNNACLADVVQLNDISTVNNSSIVSWAWDYENDGVIDDTNQTTQNLYQSAGVYNPLLIVYSAQGCVDTVLKTVTIHPMPEAEFTFSNQCYGTTIPFVDGTTIASGNVSNWQWYFGDGNTSIQQSPQHNYNAEGIYSATLVVTSNNGCKDTIKHFVEVWPIPVVNFSPTEVCFNTPTQFTDLTTVSNNFTQNNIVSWNWDFGDNSGTSAQQNPIYQYNSEGKFYATLTVVSNNGCANSQTLEITVNPIPHVDFIADITQGCSPLTINFTDNSSIDTLGNISGWHWDFGNGNTSSAQSPSGVVFNNPSHTNTAYYNVILSVTSDKGCTITDSMSQMLTVFPKPLADFAYSPEEANIYDSEITFTDLSVVANQWLWDVGDKGTTFTNQHPVHHYTDSGDYYVTLFIENTFGCKDTTQKKVRIEPAFALWIPNAFTPDSDNKNDYFFAKGYGIDEIETLIFDRWGELIFEGNQLDSQWDGRYKNGEIKQDVYVYKIRAKDIFGKWHEYIGKVTVVI
jgi:gliding motility-associated-like protein